MKAFQELGSLFGERARKTRCCCGMEDIGMLIFYLPIIIFEAMLGNASKQARGDEFTLIDRR